VSLGMVFHIICLILCFIAGTGLVSFPGAVFWCLFALTLGLLLDRVPLPAGRA